MFFSFNVPHTNGDTYIHIYAIDTGLLSTWSEKRGTGWAAQTVVAGMCVSVEGGVNVEGINLVL